MFQSAWPGPSERPIAGAICGPHRLSCQLARQSPTLKTAKTILDALSKTLGPTGDYATRSLLETAKPECNLAFENALDAASCRFGASHMTSRYHGWASQRAFALDAAALTTGVRPSVAARAWPHPASLGIL